MKKPANKTYALLGLLGIRSWTGYELIQQAQRSLRYAWPSSEAHLYREQKLLVRLGWAAVEKEKLGNRTRNRYTITPAGRQAFREWLRTSPDEPRLEVEGVVRMFFADQADTHDLIASLEATSAHARAALEPMAEMVEDYLATGGPFPERLHLIALSADLITDLLARIETFTTDAAQEASGWETTEGLGMTEATRARLERILKRSGRRSRR